MAWSVIRLWKPISGKGQSLSLSTGTAGNFTAVGAQTYAVAIRLAYAATPYMAFVRVGGGSAAAETDFPICSNDPPQLIACGAGDVVSVYQASGSTQTAYLAELTP
jgi:hypothetical protein